MNKPYTLAAAALITAAVLLLSLLSDPFIAGKVPQSDGFTWLARFFSLLGNGVTLSLIGIAFLIAGSVRKDGAAREAGKEGIYSILLGSLLVHALKAAFERPRLEHVDGYLLKYLEDPSFFDLTGRFNSFPSGHTTVSFALAFVLARRFPRFGLVFYLLAALVGAARVYLGSHYPSDVAGGAFLGVFTGWLIIGRAGKERWAVAGVLFLALFLSFFKSGGFFVFDVDEAVFSEASREMAETGDYITPTYNYEPRYDKPILIYWLMSSAFKVFGVNEFAARFTSGAFGTLLVAMTFFFVRRFKGLRAAVFASLCLLINIEFFVYSHSAVTDMTLAFFISASLFSFFIAANGGERRWYLGFWAASALAVLTKGVVGVLFPFAIAFAYLLLSKDLKRLRELFRPSYIVLFLAISVPWFAAELSVNGWEFFNAFIVKHHIKRYSDVISSHSGPFYYYLMVLAIGFFPWVALLPWAVYRGLKERLENTPGLYLFASVWFVFVLVFFSIARTKLPNYIFPLFPAAGILAGLYACALSERLEKKGALYAMAALSAVLAGGLFVLPSLGLKAEVYFQPRFFYFLGSVFAVISGLFLFAMRRPLPALAGAFGMTAMLIVFLRVYAIPPASIYLQKTVYDYGRYAGSLPADTVIAAYEINKPSFAFYSQRRFLKLEKTNACNIKEYEKGGRLLVFTTDSRLKELDGEHKTLKVIDSENGYVLLGSEGLPPFRKSP